VPGIEESEFAGLADLAMTVSVVIVREADGPGRAVTADLPQDAPIGCPAFAGHDKG